MRLDLKIAGASSEAAACGGIGGEAADGTRNRYPETVPGIGGEAAEGAWNRGPSHNKV